MNTPPPNNDAPGGAADAFTTREPVDLVSLALASLDGLTADNAFSLEMLERAAKLVRAARTGKRKRRSPEGSPAEPNEKERAIETVFARVRAVLGGAFGKWEREVLMRAALGAGDERERIIRTDDLSTNVAVMLEALSRRHAEAGLFRRADVLGIVSDDGAVRFRQAPWETIAACADEALAVFDAGRGEGGQTEVTRVRALSLRGEFAALLGGDVSQVPELKGFAFGAVLRSDGTVFEGEGFDRESGYFARAGARAPLPEPTPANARAALLALLSPFVDFPFDGATSTQKPTPDELAANSHAVGMVAAILTAVCRSAFSGPAPGFIIEANTRGAGKSLLAHVVGVIATGATVAVSTIASDEAERRKSVMSRMLAGEPVVILDNAKGMLGGEALEAALTGEYFSDRLLGQSKPVTARNSALWIITGNNCTVSSDFARRVQPVRLSYPAERPEDRDASAYAIPDLKEWAHANRAAMWAHAITLVRSFIVAGRPKPARAAKSYGSFEGWDATIRHALLFAGAADPDRARQEFRERADTERDSLSDLLRLLRDLSTVRHGGGSLAAQDVLKACVDPHGNETELLRALRDMGVRGGAPTTRGVGKALASIRDTVCDGLKLEGTPDRNGVTKWTVVSVAGLAGNAESVSSPTHREQFSIDEKAEGLSANSANHSNPAWAGASSSDSDSTLAGAHPVDPFGDDVTVVRVRDDGSTEVLHDGSRKAAS
jgi:hypothetical protein